MRKFICTADIHISIKKDIPEKWQLDRYNKLFETLIEDCLTQKAQLIIAGDLFDKVQPSLAELQLFFKLVRLLKENKVTFYIIAGNHETVAARTPQSLGVHTFTYLRESVDDYSVLGNGSLSLDQENTQITFVSHCDIAEITHEHLDYNYSQLLVTHFRTTVGEYIKEEMDTKALCANYDLVIAGDIHSDFQIENLVYTNQPVNSQFETKPNCGYVILSVTRNTRPKIERVSTNHLPMLRAVNCSVDDLEEQLTLVNEKDFYRINVTGSLKELRGIKVNLPNVKVNKIPLLDEVGAAEIKQQEVIEALPLDAQLVEYLKLLNYSEDSIADLIDVLKETK